MVETEASPVIYPQRQKELELLKNPRLNGELAAIVLNSVRALPFTSLVREPDRLVSPSLQTELPATERSLSINGQN